MPVSARIRLIISLLIADNVVSDLSPHSVLSEHAWPCAHTHESCAGFGHFPLERTTELSMASLQLCSCGPIVATSQPKWGSGGFLPLPRPWRAVTSFISHLPFDTRPHLSRSFQLPWSGDSTDAVGLWLLNNKIPHIAPTKCFPELYLLSFSALLCQNGEQRFLFFGFFFSLSGCWQGYQGCKGAGALQQQQRMNGKEAGMLGFDLAFLNIWWYLIRPDIWW